MLRIKNVLIMHIAVACLILISARASAEGHYEWAQQTDVDAVTIFSASGGEPIAVGNNGRFSIADKPVSVAIAGGDAFNMIPIDLVAAVENFKLVEWTEEDFQFIDTFPIQAIGKKGSRILGGTTGLIIASDNSGSDWYVVDVLRQISEGKGENGTHETCVGMEQKGRVSSKKKQWIGVRRVCDIVFMSGRAIVAYDKGLAYNDNLDQHIADPTDKSCLWQGVPPNDENELFGLIVNDVEVKDADAIIAATSDGVWESSDRGGSWTQIGLEGQKTFSVHISADGEYYAGGVDGVYKMTDSKWEKIGELKKVYDIDEFGPSLLAGTREGLFARTDAEGSGWQPLSDKKDFTEARAISASESEIFVATEKGLFSATYVEDTE